MQVLSLNVGMPREIEYRGEAVTTGIYKHAVDGPLRVRRLNVDGDGQADLSVHGGVDKAVYAFPSEHYAVYQQQLDQSGYDPGQFGENLTTRGMLETEVRIGDRYRIGDALLEVSQPRSPCYKFAIRMDTAQALRVCIELALTGFYLRVIEEGEVRGGDDIELEVSDPAMPSVDRVHRTYYLERDNLEALRQCAACVPLASAFRDAFVARLGELETRS